MTMTPRQQAGVAKMIVEITQELRCILEIGSDEVTVYEDRPGTGGRHSHHGGKTLYDRVAKALEAAKEYAAARMEDGAR